MLRDKVEVYFFYFRELNKQKKDRKEDILPFM